MWSPGTVATALGGGAGGQTRANAFSRGDYESEVLTCDNCEAMFEVSGTVSSDLVWLTSITMETRLRVKDRELIATTIVARGEDISLCWKF